MLSAVKLLLQVSVLHNKVCYWLTVNFTKWIFSRSLAKHSKYIFSRLPTHANCVRDRTFIPHVTVWWINHLVRTYAWSIQTQVQINCQLSWLNLLTSQLGISFLQLKFLTKIKQVQRDTNVQLWNRDSWILEGAGKRYPLAVRDANPSLKYYSLHMACVCGGRKSGKEGKASKRKVG